MEIRHIQIIKLLLIHIQDQFTINSKMFSRLHFFRLLWQLIIRFIIVQIHKLPFHFTFNNNVDLFVHLKSTFYNHIIILLISNQEQYCYKIMHKHQILINVYYIMNYTIKQMTHHILSKILLCHLNLEIFIIWIIRLLLHLNFILKFKRNLIYILEINV